MIEVKDLVKRYGNHYAVDHLSFTLEDGCIYGFLGPNGAGKSTTMNIITGYLGATEGQVIVEGHDILQEPEQARRAIGYLPEVPPLYSDMTVEEQLHFAARLKGVRKAETEEQLDRVLQLTHLEDVSQRLIRNLSKGYRQRVGLAQALLGFPKVLILDEPMVGLDPKQILEVRDLIRSLAREHTVFFSSHILSEVQEICDRILIIQHGKLLANDTPENLEAGMTGGKQLELEVKGAEETVRGVLEPLTRLTVSELRETEGVTRAVLRWSGEEDMREQIFYAFNQAHCPILTMKATESSLEQVFLELTEKGGEISGETEKAAKAGEAPQPSEEKEEP